MSTVTTKVNLGKIVDDVSKASKTLMFSEPYYGLFLIGMNKVYKNDLPTAGVSKLNMGVQPAINPEYFDTLNEKQQQGLMKHEILHVSLGHLMIEISSLIISCSILLQILRSISIYLLTCYLRVH